MIFHIVPRVVALYPCEEVLRPTRRDGAEIRGIDMQDGEVALGLEWADDAVGRDVLMDHGTAAVVSAFACKGLMS